MKTEFLKELGIAEDIISKIMAENGKDIEATKGKFSDYDTLKSQVKTYETEISNLKTTETDNVTLKSDLETLKKQIKDKEEADKTAVYEKNMQERFSNLIGETKFVNDFTKNAVFSEWKKSLEDTANVGKGDKDLFDSLTKDKENVFANPNPGVNIPGIGAGSANLLSAEAFKAMPLMEQMKLAKENPQEYAKMKNLIK